MSQYQAAQKKRIRLSALIILVVLPALLGLSVFLLHNEWYMVLSFIMLIAIMAPFFMIFEQRKPKAREVVLIAVLSAITVVLHSFFHIVLPLQIGTALVIIFGISLGPEAGFLIGALARFVCNFYLGQGMWTPWQMFCWGLLGFLAGLAFHRGELPMSSVYREAVAKTGGDRAGDTAIEDTDTKITVGMEKAPGASDSTSGRLRVFLGPILTILFFEVVGYISYVIYPGNDVTFFSWRLYAFGLLGLFAAVLLQRKRLPVNTVTLCIFTFFTTFIIYGGIMNLAALITGMNLAETEGLSGEALRAWYISGVPYDLLHAGTATLCVFLLGNPMIQKLERIKIKYGIYK